MEVIRVYVEGQATEPEYVRALKNLDNVRGSVALRVEIVESGKSPIFLVQRACDDMRRNDIEADSFWCLFDVEAPSPHSDLMAAVDQARANGVRLAISNPCLWLVLHLENQSAYMTTDDAVGVRKKLDRSNGKHFDPSVYMPFLDRAGESTGAARYASQKWDVLSE